MESSLIKQDNNKKYWIIGIVLIVMLGVYLAATNVDFTKININFKFVTDKPVVENSNQMSNTSSASDITNMFNEENFMGIFMLIVSITVFGVVLFIVGRIFFKQDEGVI
jgi:disulfide bond formation protein DsbB